MTSRVPPNHAQDKSDGEGIAAAEYIRMSTEHQRYSTQNQCDAIRAYATHHGYKIVRTYADEGRSGLTAERRFGLRALISDVTSGDPGYSLVLVYDISRWGRFQDMDESAFYEYQCRRSGVRVEYCAEPFDNDGSFSSDIQKALKRKMAAEYSRELSHKVFIGQCRLVELGFRQGGPVGFGLRRLLIDEDGRPKCQLRRREHKSIATDRVILVPGPPDEVRTVERIYRRFVEGGGITEAGIAVELNDEGIKTDLGRPWQAHTVRQILRNEKYIGNNVWNRRSQKLSGRAVENDPNLWLRVEGAFEPVISRGLFEEAQSIFLSRRIPVSDEAMLEHLRLILAEHGAIDSRLIDGIPGAPRAQTYRRRFGSLLNAYQLVGYKPADIWSTLELRSRIQSRFLLVVRKTLETLRGVGVQARYDKMSRLLRINDELSATVALALPCRHRNRSFHWSFHFNPCKSAALTIATRLEDDQETVKDHFLLPSLTTPRRRYELREERNNWLIGYRIESLECITDLLERVPLRDIAEKIENILPPFLNEPLSQQAESELAREERRVSEIKKSLKFALLCLRTLLEDENFITLLRAEGIGNMPKIVADLLLTPSAVGNDVVLCGDYSVGARDATIALVVAKGFLGKLLRIAPVVRYIERHHGDIHSRLAAFVSEPIDAGAPTRQFTEISRKANTRGSKLTLGLG